MYHKFALHLSRSCFGLSLVLLSICLDPGVVRSQSLNTASDLTQTLPAPVLPPPQILPPPRLETPLPAPPNPSPLPPSNNLLQPPAQPPSEPQSPGTGPADIRVNEFRFIGNTAFSSKRLAQQLTGFTNRFISFSQLLQARNAITDFYVSKGYLTSGALIPRQTLQGGVITIQVVEDRVEKIRVTATRRLSPKYVRSRLAIAASEICGSGGNPVSLDRGGKRTRANLFAYNISIRGADH